VNEALQNKIDALYISESTLARTKNTLPQTDLSREARRTNVSGAFELRAKKDVLGKHVLLVDDVVTTGATLSEAKKTLREGRPAHVTCVALAG